MWTPIMAMTHRVTTAKPLSRGLPTAHAVAAPMNTRKYMPDVTLGRIIPENINRNKAMYFPEKYKELLLMLKIVKSTYGTTFGNDRTMA